jgi:hypothetical protein
LQNAVYLKIKDISTSQESDAIFDSLSDDELIKYNLAKAEVKNGKIYLSFAQSIHPSYKDHFTKTFSSGLPEQYIGKDVNLKFLMNMLDGSTFIDQGFIEKYPHALVITWAIKNPDIPRVQGKNIVLAPDYYTLTPYELDGWQSKAKKASKHMNFALKSKKAVFARGYNIPSDAADGHPRLKLAQCNSDSKCNNQVDVYL